MKKKTGGRVNHWGNTRFDFTMISFLVLSLKHSERTNTRNVQLSAKFDGIGTNSTRTQKTVSEKKRGENELLTFIRVIM